MHRKKTEIALIKKYGLLLPGTSRGARDPAVSTAWEPPETAWQGSRLAIEPGRGIGPLELGMASGKILEALRRLYTGLGLPPGKFLISGHPGQEKGECRYQAGDLFAMVLYQEGRAAEIGIGSSLRTHIPITLYGMDCFRMPAEALLEALKAYGPHIFQGADEELGTEYAFPSLGLRLWREGAFHPKLLSDAAYVSGMSAVLEEEYKYRYFELAFVSR